MNENTPPPTDRIATGIPGLDTLLHGGIVKGGVYMVLGMPGAGKTILANQVCFHHVQQGGRALYITLLAESHTRMITNLRALDFFDPTHIADSLAYLSAYSVLEEGGLDALFELLRREVKAHRASLLVLDGLVAAEEVATSSRAFKKFIHGLQVITGLVGCTTMMLTTGSGKGLKAEHTMVDGLLVLRERTYGVRAVRELTIRKFRGSGHQRGQHCFDITPEGIVVYPRLEVMVADNLVTPPSVTRKPLGIPTLDAMLSGGVFEGSTTMLLGPSGSGKSLLGLHFLAEGALRGEKGHYFAFYDAPQRVHDQGASVGLDLKPLVAQGLLELSFRPPTENRLDQIGHELLTMIQQKGVRRIFLDGYDGLCKAVVHPPRVARFMAALVNLCRAHNVTLLFTAETPKLFGFELELPVHGISMLCENILFVRYAETHGRLKRFISVLKLRTSAHDHALREFHISDQGLRVGSPVTDAQWLMSGMALESSQVRAPPKRRGR